MISDTKSPHPQLNMSGRRASSLYHDHHELEMIDSANQTGFQGWEQSSPLFKQAKLLQATSGGMTPTRMIMIGETDSQSRVGNT